MLCSKCGETIKPVVAIDIDGTLGDYHGHFLKFAEGYLGAGEDLYSARYTGQSEFKEWFTKRFSVGVETFRHIKLAYRQGGMKRTMPVFDGAADLTRAIKEAGGEVWLTTTRPYLRLDGIDPDTRAWLSRHEIQYDGLLYDEDKYKVLADRIDPVRMAAVLDDLPEQIVNAWNAFPGLVPIWRLNGYNGSTPWRSAHLRMMEEAGELSTAKSIILNRIKAWREQHE